MNPEQVREIVSRAMSDRDPWLFLYIVVVAIVSFAAALFGPYLKKRLEDRATKKSLPEKTHIEESIKSFYGKDIETLKAWLGTRSHFNRLRYERETEVYRELWTALVETGQATQSLRAFLEPYDPSETEEKRKLRKAMTFAEKRRHLYEITTKNRPFYPSEVWEKLNGFLQFTHEEFVQFQFIDPRNGGPAKTIEYFDKAATNQAEITKRINDICEAIRHRLDKFDGPDFLA